MRPALGGDLQALRELDVARVKQTSNEDREAERWLVRERGR